MRIQEKRGRGRYFLENMAKKKILNWKIKASDKKE